MCLVGVYFCVLGLFINDFGYHIPSCEKKNAFACVLCDFQRDRLHYICCTMNLFEWILNLLYDFGKPFHGGTKIYIILALPPRSMAAQPTFWPPVTGSTHIPPLFVSFCAGIYVHTTYEYAHSLCFFFSSSPRDGKNIRPVLKGVRN